MDNEESINKVDVRGLSTFALCAIPLVLGGAASIWLGVLTGVIEFKHHLTLAERMDNRVGVTAPLKTPVSLNIHNTNCMRITRAFLDGNQVVMYVQNDCTPDKNGTMSYAAWGWRANAPDGTIIGADMSNTLNPQPKGATAEEKMNIPDDDRIVSITVWASNSE